MEVTTARNERLIPVSLPDRPVGGHYSPAIVAGGYVFTSGQLPICRSGAILANEAFEDQARQVLRNLAEVLDQAASGLQEVVKITVFLVGVDNWPTFDRIFAEFFGAHRPARSVIPVPELHFGCLLEVEAISVKNSAELPSSL